jgi:hypothetical protein
VSPERPKGGQVTLFPLFPAVRNEAEQSLDPRELNLALRDGQAEPIGRGRPGGGGPELVDVLWDYTEHLAVGLQRIDSRVDRGVVRVGNPGVTK